MNRLTRDEYAFITPSISWPEHVNINSPSSLHVHTKLDDSSVPIHALGNMREIWIYNWREFGKNAAVENPTSESLPVAMCPFPICIRGLINMERLWREAKFRFVVGTGGRSNWVARAPDFSNEGYCKLRNAHISASRRWPRRHWPSCHWRRAGGNRGAAICGRLRRRPAAWGGHCGNCRAAGDSRRFRPRRAY